jgi:hypothetical protein
MSPPILFNNPLDSLVSKLLKTDGAMDRGWMFGDVAPLCYVDGKEERRQ